MPSSQANFWRGRLARQYHAVSVRTPAEIDRHWMHMLGRSRVGIDREMLSCVARETPILEVGCGTGNQLIALAEMGFNNFAGIDINQEAVEIARERLPGADIRLGTATDLPFNADRFGLVYTSALLIHIPPAEISAVQREIARVANRWIYGYEYYSPSPVARASTLGGVVYHPVPPLTFKAPFKDYYLGNCPALRVERAEMIKHSDGTGNADEAFLLRKGDI